MTSNSHLHRTLKAKHTSDLSGKCGLLLLVGLFCIGVGSAHAVEMAELRLKAGLDLFQSILAADMDIAKKKGPNGSLLLMLVYKNDAETAENLARNLMNGHRIQGIPIRVKTATMSTLISPAKDPPAGIFLVQELKHELPSVIDFGTKHSIIVFSPIEGDVEAGVLGGIHISDRLLPHINIRTLKASRLRIKPFFLRVSKHYEK